ncbi:MAG: FAD-dependent oxidoreductase [Phycisphaerae bacterium]|nr:FAD-dependent oxidoreductase [Phycisphaerae bacterium]
MTEVRRVVGKRNSPERVVETDLTVAGAGLAGVAAALSAARLGMRVALVTDRSVLGGNASKEVRLDANGATWFGLYRRESGIIEELLLENLHRNAQANIEIWDMLLLDAVRREKRIQVFFDTAVFEATKRGRRLQSVSGFQTTTGRKLDFRSPWFVDSTGDGTVGYLAGASFMRGREDRRQFGESSAATRADRATMGNSLLMSFRRTDHRIDFRPPSFAHPIATICKMIERSQLRLHDVQQYDRWAVAFWWIEYGGLLDTIADAEEIRVELERIAWGVYDYIKNSGCVKDVENLDLAWMQSCPGKRESRRFIGGHVLTENDILNGTRFRDAVAYGGWPMDDHPPEGFWGDRSSISRPVNPYDIPLRSLYARDLDNLFLAGRDISVSHLAFSSTRVMATCAQMGQAVGTAAFLCRKWRCPPRRMALEEARIAELQDSLIRNDATILDTPYDIRKNKARLATITASSTFGLQNTRTLRRAPLADDAYFLCYVKEGMQRILFKADARRDANCRIEIYQSPPIAYAPGELIDTQTVPLPAGRNRWFAVSLKSVRSDGPVFIRLRRNPNLDLHYGGSPFTLFTAVDRKEGSFDDVRHTKYTQAADNLCFRTDPPVCVHAASQVINGHTRPALRPNSWISQPGEAIAWLALSWPVPTTIRRVDLFFNPDFNGRINNSSRNPIPLRSTLVRDYTIRCRQPRGWNTLCRVRDNYQRWNRHELPKTIETTDVRIEFEATWGVDYSEVFEAIVY